MDHENMINPHDKFFKESFGRTEIAQSFIQEYLPHDLIKTMKINTLEITKDTFIDKELQEHFSDILYRVKIAGRFRISIFYSNIRAIAMSGPSFNFCGTWSRYGSSVSNRTSVGSGYQ
ncbi:MAG: Rpn family recombination-promoting nuclease/putative transposase [Chitinivibrionales bacterium]|nr:Rpn family recombination-promoting nuclease/putative transposase [Chitinivibrionales bacterium]